MKQVYMSEDGQPFDSQEACEAYEKAMGIKTIVMKWANEEYGDKQGQSTSATNKVMAWEQVRDRLLSEGTADEPAVHAVAG